MRRKKIIVKNVSLGVFFKILNIALVYTIIPLLLNFLEPEQYGVWITIFSVVNIVFFVDLGIGNGLKTKLTQALSQDNIQAARAYISTAYLSILGIGLLLFVVGALSISAIDLQNLLNTNIPEIQLKQVFFITLIFVVTSFVLNLYKTFYYATHQSSKVELSLLLYQSLILIAVFIVLNYFSKSLLLVASIYGISNILIGLLFTLYFFKKNPKIKPSIKYFNKKRVNDLMGLSMSFFVIQMCMIVIFATDNVIISKLLGPSEVTTYDIVYKLFQLTITISIIAQDPFWPLYTDAFQKKDLNWIRKTLLRLNKLFIPFIFIVIVLIFTAPTIIDIWIPTDLIISQRLLIFMGIFILIRAYGIIYMYFLNAIGKIKLQLWLYVFGAIVNIPLSIYFVKYLDLGSSGVILGTILSIGALTILLPIQVFKILNPANL